MYAESMHFLVFGVSRLFSWFRGFQIRCDFVPEVSRFPKNECAVVSCFHRICFLLL